jgi:hypothetical protein
MASPAIYCVVSAAIAGAVTIFDLDRTFVVGGPQSSRVHRSTWWWAFILANSGLAITVFFALRHVKFFSAWGPWEFSIAVGVGYLALARLKFATISYQDEEAPVGIDIFYESGRQFVFKRINEAIKREREQVARQYILDNDLRSLGSIVRLSIELDALLTAVEKKTRLTWLLQVLEDTTFDEEQKKLTLAIYLASGTQP